MKNTSLALGLVAGISLCSAETKLPDYTQYVNVILGDKLYVMHNDLLAELPQGDIRCKRLVTIRQVESLITEKYGDTIVSQVPGYSVSTYSQDYHMVDDGKTGIEMPYTEISEEKLKHIKYADYCDGTPSETPEPQKGDFIEV